MPQPYRTARRGSIGSPPGRRSVLGRRTPAAILTAALILAGCPGCGGTGASKDARPLKIGISLSLTGSFSNLGKAAQRGYQVWVETVDAAGGLLGRQVELVILNDESSPERVAANYEELISKRHVDLVLGPVSTLLTVPASQVAARHRYAFIEPAGGGPKVFDQHLDNLFFVQPAPVVKQGAVFARFILSLPADQRPATAAYPALDDPYAQPIADEVRAQFEAAGIRTVYTHTYPADTTDLTSVMAEVAAARPDAVVAGTQSEDAYAAVRAMVGLKWAPEWLYLSNGANSPVDFPDKVGAANTNGIFTSSDWSPTSNASGSAAFVGAYLKKYGGAATDIDSTSAEAYSAGLLIQQVAAKTHKIDNATIIATLHSGVWPTPVGDLSWDDSGVPRGSFMLQQWIDGKLTAVYPPGRAQHEPVGGRPPWAA